MLLKPLGFDFDTESLNKYKIINKFSSILGIDPIIIVFLIGLNIYLMLVVIFGERILSNLIFIILPFFSYILQMPTPSKRYKINFLLFWALFSLLLLIEKTIPMVDDLFPFPYIVRFIFLLWLLQFYGAMGFYDYVIEPLTKFLWGVYFSTISMFIKNK